MNGTAVMIQQNKFMRAFRQAGALSASKARSLDELRLRPGLLFRRMVARGVFVSAGSDRWYMSDSEADAFIRRRRRVMLIVLTLAAVTIIIVWAAV